MNNLGVCLESGSGCDKNEKKSVEFYEKAANMGNEFGIINISNWFFYFLNYYFIEQYIILGWSENRTIGSNRPK